MEYLSKQSYLALKRINKLSLQYTDNELEHLLKPSELSKLNYLLVHNYICRIKVYASDDTERRVIGIDNKGENYIYTVRRENINRFLCGIAFPIIVSVVTSSITTYISLLILGVLR